MLFFQLQHIEAHAAIAAIITTSSSSFLSFIPSKLLNILHIFADMGDSYNDNIGDIIWINFDQLGIKLECIVTEVDPIEKRACRFKAAHSDPLWGSIGLIEEDGEWVVVEWSRELEKITKPFFSDN